MLKISFTFDLGGLYLTFLSGSTYTYTYFHIIKFLEPHEMHTLAFNDMEFNKLGHN